MPTDAVTAHPPACYVDKDTGHRVLRLTPEQNSASAYFNYSVYSPDGREMVYTTPDGFSVLDLATLKRREIVHGDVRIIGTGHKTARVFYVRPDQNAVFVTDLAGNKEKRLAALPKDAAVFTLNADESLVAGTYPEGNAADPADSYFGPHAHPTLSKGKLMEMRLAARIPTAIFTLNLSTGEVKVLQHTTDWIGHMQFSPTDPTLLLYCHEGPWDKVDRIWLIHTDGTGNRLLHTRSMPMEIAGHEFWSWDGRYVLYDLQRPRSKSFFLAQVDVKTNERTWYAMQRDEWSIHFNISRDGKLFAGDGGDPGQVAKAENGEWIWIFHPELTGKTVDSPDGPVHMGILHAEPLVNMSGHNYHLEPNVRFTPEDKWIVFRSNLFGPTYVFAAEVEKTGKPCPAN